MNLDRYQLQSLYFFLQNIADKCDYLTSHNQYCVGYSNVSQVKLEKISHPYASVRFAWRLGLVTHVLAFCEFLPAGCGRFTTECVLVVLGFRSIICQVIMAVSCQNKPREEKSETPASTPDVQENSRTKWPYLNVSIFIC